MTEHKKAYEDKMANESPVPTLVTGATLGLCRCVQMVIVGWWVYFSEKTCGQKYRNAFVHWGTVMLD